MTKTKHKKIRFSRRALSTLNTMPSHGDARGPVHAPILAPLHLIKRRFFIGILLFFLASIVAAGAYVARGNLGPLLREQAQNAFIRFVPPSMSVKLGKTDVAFFWHPQIGVTYKNVTLASQFAEKPVTISALRLGLEPWSLLKADPVFNAVEISGVAYEMPKNSDGKLPEIKLTSARGLFDVFSVQLSSVGRKFLDANTDLKIKLEDIIVQLPDDTYSDHIEISSLALTTKDGSANIIGDIIVDGYPVEVSGNLSIPSDTEPNLPLRLSLNAKSLPMPWRRLRTLVSDDPSDRESDKRHAPILGDMSMSIVDATTNTSDQFNLSITPRDMFFKLDVDDVVPVSGQLDLAMDFEKSVLQIKPNTWSVGRSEFILSGGVRDLAQKPSRNAFEFEVLANRGVAIASDASEEPVRFAARALGSTLFEEELISFSKLEVDSDSGTLSGRGDLSLAGDIQTAVFELIAENMSIAGVKQLWPAPVARTARAWVLANLAGGRVIKGKIDIAEPLRLRIEGTTKEFSGATKVALSVEGVRFDVTGDIPPMRDADGEVFYNDGVTKVTLKKGTLYLPSGRTADAKNGTLTILRSNPVTGLIKANLALGVAGQARAVGELISFKPINATQFYAFDPADLTGSVDGKVKVDFVLNGGAGGPQPDWAVDLDIADAGSATKIEGRKLDNLSGRIKVDPRRAEFDLKGDIDDLPADIAVVIPFGNSGVAAKRDIAFQLSAKDREKLAPGLGAVLTGPTPVKVSASGSLTKIEASLTAAKLDLPWIGWAKGAGIKSTTVFNVSQNNGTTSLTDFKISGGSFGINNGRIDIDASGLKNVRFGFVQLSKGDNFSLDIERNGAGYKIAIGGKSLDARAMMRHVRNQARRTASSDGSAPIDLTANIARVTGFHGEDLKTVKITLQLRGGSVTKFALSGSTDAGFPVYLDLDGAGSGRSIKLEALGAGEFLRFADLYTNVRGGTLNVALKGTGPQSMAGKADLFDFRVFNEPKLAQLVSSKAENSESLQQAIKREIDTREVKFERASSNLVFKPGSLDITEAVARGPLAGFTIQGKVFDSNNRTRLTGTFLPAYGLNRIFGEIPILGNGRDRGLIGVTFKLEGSFDGPNVTVNPLSVIAPGIFRSIFEFR